MCVHCSPFPLTSHSKALERPMTCARKILSSLQNTPYCHVVARNSMRIAVRQG